MQLTRKLSLEKVERTPDGAGGYDEVWVELGKLWAELRAGTGRESFDSAVTVSSVPYRIIVRAAPMESPQRPKPEQRFREGARIFMIRGVAELDASARYLTCFATEEVAG